MRVTFLALLVLAVLAVMLGRVRRKPPDPQAAAATAMLRQKILTREFIQAAGPGHPGVPRCVLMDWNIGGAVATVVAFDDGSTSLYLSSASALQARANRPARHHRDSSGHLMRLCLQSPART